MVGLPGDTPESPPTERPKARAHRPRERERERLEAIWKALDANNKTNPSDSKNVARNILRP